MKAKGLVVKLYPEHWVNWQNPDKSNERFTKEEIELNNKLLIEKRPYFMKYLYPRYKQKFKEHHDRYNYFCERKYGITIDELLKLEHLTEEQENIVKNYNKFNPFIETACVMNNICRFMEKSVEMIKINANKRSPEYIFEILFNKNIEITQEQIDEMEKVFKRYRKSRSLTNRLGDNVIENDGIMTKEDFVAFDYDYISDDIQKLANLAVYVNYYMYPTSPKNFCWDIFPTGIILNIYDNSDKNFTIPLRNENGDIEYMGKKYKRERIDINADNF